MNLSPVAICMAFTVSNVSGDSILRYRYLKEDDAEDVFLENNSLFSCVTSIEESSTTRRVLSVQDSPEETSVEESLEDTSVEEESSPEEISVEESPEEKDSVEESSPEEPAGQNRVGFRRCSFSNSPSRQLWRFERNGGKVRSRADESQCWVVNDGETVGDGVLRLMECESATGRLATFFYDFDVIEGQIKVDISNDETLCLREGGTEADPFENEIIVVDECSRGDSFLWIQHPVRYFIMYGFEGGCIAPNMGKIRKGNSLLLVECDFSNPDVLSQWWQDEAGLIHTRQDPDFCLQASRKTLKDGSKMRLFPCDEDNELQRFNEAFGGTIQIQTRDDVCAVSQGVTVDLDEDLIIWKECDITNPMRRENGWTFPSASRD